MDLQCFGPRIAVKHEPKTVKSSQLLKIDIFSRLSSPVRKLIASKMSLFSYEVGEDLFLEGEDGNALFAILEGTVSITIQSKDGQPIELAQMGSGAFFGEMALLEKTRRSATVSAKTRVRCIVLEAEDFELLIKESPLAAGAIMERMIRMTSSRLVSTGSFLTHMVAWGEEARKRVITDEASGLFNRRYLDDSLESNIAEAQAQNLQLACTMVDLDHFGHLNREYGTSFCDKLIVRVSDIFKESFSPEDILIRYGGDEFCFIIKAPSELAVERCQKAIKAVNRLSFPEFPELSISCSMGMAFLDIQEMNAEELVQSADKALYRAKLQGRNRLSLYIKEFGHKKDIFSIAEKNKIGRRFAQILAERDDFLIIGHQDPDEDCISAMVAFALLASKFNKRSYISVASNLSDSFDYLLQICKYNNIQVLRGDPPPLCSTLLLVDTPKPSMIDRPELYELHRADPQVLKIEIDHHLEADATYFTARENALVYQASSSCEVIAWLALKIQRNKAFIEEHHIDELLSRNVVLAILTGILGDTQMGRYIKTRRERQFYERFTTLFEHMLSEKTHKGTQNLATKEQIFTTLEKLSSEEAACWQELKQFIVKKKNIFYVILEADKSRDIIQRYGHEVCISVAKNMANYLAEENGKLGLVSYYECPNLIEPSSVDILKGELEPKPSITLVQFRMRRSQSYKSLDLRDFLLRAGIEDGGGHPGAIGFRLPQDAIADIHLFEKEIIKVIDSLIDELSAKPQ